MLFSTLFGRLRCCSSLNSMGWHVRRGSQPRRLHVESLEGRLCLSSGHLLVTNWGGDSVLRYDEGSGAFVDTFVPKHAGGMNQPYGIVFGPHDHNLYVSTGQYGGPGQLKAVLRYDGETGAFIDKFTVGGDLQGPRGIIFGPDGNLYVADKLID